MGRKVIPSAFRKNKQECKEGFTILSSLIASSIIAKRMIVPFIATPAADWAKKKFIDKNSHMANDKFEWQPAQAVTLKAPVQFSCGKNVSDLYNKIKLSNHTLKA